MIKKKEVINMRRDLKRVALHMAIINDELGSVKLNMKWMKYLLFYIAAILSASVFIF